MSDLSASSTAAWMAAVHEAVNAESEYIEKEHILQGVFSLDKFVKYNASQLDITEQEMVRIIADHQILSECLSGLNTDMAKVRRAIRYVLPKGGYKHTNKGVIHRSENCKKLFLKAAAIKVSGSTSLFDLLLVIVEDPGPVISAAFSSLNLDTAELKNSIKTYLQNTPVQDNLQGQPHIPYLDKYCRDLTREAMAGKLCPFIGRRSELLQILQTLARSRKSNPVIVGEAGVGKTAVVEALAARGAAGKDSSVLGGKRIMELNLGALQGGTRYRGDFEERLTKIMQEVNENPDIIIFIDEIHNLTGAGKGEGSMDAANILKPALARGDFVCIGATTTDEYRRHIEKDPALARRFEMVLIPEPSRDETIEIIRGLKAKWENHYGVIIEDSAIEAAVDFSIRFDTDHNLPDKAIDLIDKAGARSKIPMLSMMQGQVMTDIDGANRSFVTEDVVARVVHEKTGVPQQIIMGTASGSTDNRILNLATGLLKTIIGQDEAVRSVSQRLKLSYAGITPMQGPLGVFLFLGPTGVGKTEMAKAMAEILFGSQDQMIRLDMSEFMEEHSVSKLIGSPPGYVGYEEQGQLTGAIRSRPFCICLLDEVEKAHWRIFDLFLQLFDEGRITDAKGRSIDARNVIFIMTSNLGGGISEKAGLGFVQGNGDTQMDGHASIRELSKFFRVEFLNRIHEIITFKSLDLEAVKQITRIICKDQLRALRDRYGVELHLSDAVLAKIAENGSHPDFGARGLKRNIERMLSLPLSTLALEGRFEHEKYWMVELEHGEIKFNRNPNGKP